MELEELWKQFVASGKIADYLRFADGARAEAAEELAPDHMNAPRERPAGGMRDDGVPDIVYPAGSAPEVTIPGVAVPGETLKEEIRRQMRQENGI